MAHCTQVPKPKPLCQPSPAEKFVIKCKNEQHVVWNNQVVDTDISVRMVQTVLRFYLERGLRLASAHLSRSLFVSLAYRLPVEADNL